jgi:uncharacterized Tic20 family protein
VQSPSPGPSLVYMSQNPPEKPDPTPEGAATSADPPAYPSSTGSAIPAGSGEAPSSYPSGSDSGYPASGGSAPDPTQPYGYGQPPAGGYGQPAGGGYGQPPANPPYSQPSGPQSANPPYSQPSGPQPANPPYSQPSGPQPTYGQPGYPDPNAAYPQQGYDANANYGGQSAGYPQQGGYPPYTDPNQPQGYPPQPYTQPGYPQQPYAGAPGQAPVTESDEKTWGIISHISIPFFGFIGPLIGYLLYKDRSAYLKQVTTEALNFSILYSIVQVAGWILAFITFGLINLLGFVAGLVFCIMATMAASRHEFYKYPVNTRMIK